MTDSSNAYREHFEALATHDGWWRGTVRDVVEGSDGGLVFLEEDRQGYAVTVAQLAALREAFGVEDLAGRTIDFRSPVADGPPPAEPGPLAAVEPAEPDREDVRAVHDFGFVEPDRDPAAEAEAMLDALFGSFGLDRDAFGRSVREAAGVQDEHRPAADERGRGGR